MGGEALCLPGWQPNRLERSSLLPHNLQHLIGGMLIRLPQQQSCSSKTANCGPPCHHRGEPAFHEYAPPLKINRRCRFDNQRLCSRGQKRDFGEASHGQPEDPVQAKVGAGARLEHAGGQILQHTTIGDTFAMSVLCRRSCCAWQRTIARCELPCAWHNLGTVAPLQTGH